MSGASAPALVPELCCGDFARSLDVYTGIFGFSVRYGREGFALLERTSAGGIPRFREPEEVWYRAGDAWLGQRQAILMDLDGYLLRLCESLGRRAEPGAGRIAG